MRFVFEKRIYRFRTCYYRVVIDRAGDDIDWYIYVVSDEYRRVIGILYRSQSTENRTRTVLYTVYGSSGDISGRIGTTDRVEGTRAETCQS